MGRPRLVAGHASRAHFARQVSTAGLIGLLMTLMVGSTVAHAAGSVSVTTPYPGVAVAPGAKVSFDLSIETDTADRVNLRLERVPAAGRPASSAAASSSTASRPTARRRPRSAST